MKVEDNVDDIWDYSPEVNALIDKLVDECIDEEIKAADQEGQWIDTNEKS